MRISASDWSRLKLALKQPRSLLQSDVFMRGARKPAWGQRGIALIGLMLLTMLVLLHVKASDPAVRRLTELGAQLAGARQIDTRWDAIALQVRTEGAYRPVVQHTDLARVQRALDAAAADAKTTALRVNVMDLKKAYVEKADLVTRLESASNDARQALAAAKRSDLAFTTLVRGAWRDFPQRERLVAAENLVVRAIADAQQYHYTPTAAHRAALASHAADLSKAQPFPKPLLAALTSLENDIHQLLLLKPLEQLLTERLNALKTAQRLDEVSEVFQHMLTDTLAQRARYRVALLVYSVLLLALLTYLVMRTITSYRDLEMLYRGQTRALAKALHALRASEDAAQANESARSDTVTSEQQARPVHEHRRTAL